MDLKFTNGKFVILQVSDPQDLQWVRPAMVRMLDKAYDRVQPDLVIFTGDNILGNHLRDARFGTRPTAKTAQAEFDRMKTAIGHIVRPVEKRHIPFTMIYGNHDDMNGFTKEEQAEIYRAYPMCVGIDGGKETGDIATFNIPLYSSDGGSVVFNLWCMDSAWMDKADGKCHTAVKPQALEWYKRKCAELKERCGKTVPSLMFQHVPLYEMTALTKECAPGEPGAVKTKRPDGTDCFIKLDETKAKGFLGEPVSACREDTGELAVLKECGDVQAVVLGHDHVNCFDGTLDGVRIIQTPAASFRCYGNRLRGVRVFELDENEPENFRTYMLYYEDLCGRSPLAELRYVWDADGEQPKKAALIAGCAAFVTASGVFAAKIISKRGK